MNESPKTLIYLADLRHNYSGVLSVDAMPLSVGFIKAVMDRDLVGENIDVRIFAYPDILFEAMKKAPPDILMVSNYMWNETLGHFFLRRLKSFNPDALAVMGGPNIYKEPERQIEYVREHPEIDVYICGEADYVATDLVRLYLEGDRSAEALYEADIPSSVYRRNGELIRTHTLPRRGTLDDIPSPFLAGIMDQFFDGKLAPMIETNRGCPFRCAFCVQGTEFYNKVNHFDLDRLNQEIRYIAERVHEDCPSMGTLRIADPNFGMYKRDVEIAGFIGEVQRDYRWPTFIDATTGKNKPERIIECLEKVNGALVLYQAVQSLDDEVLRNINRSNIKLSSYETIMIHMRGRGLRSVSDLILGLPGESLKSHVKSLYQLIDAGTDGAHCFQAMVLKGSDLETIEMREKYKFLTRYRVLPKNYGIYDGEKVFDIEEIIVGTDTLPFEDYVECRKLHLAFSIFWNDSWFADVLQFMAICGISPSQWLSGMLDAMEADDGVVKQLLDEFVGETVNELFPTYEACAEFYGREENFKRLCSGEIGDNLMYKYRAQASFFIWEAVCACAMNKTREMVLATSAGDQIENFEEFWQDFHRYVGAKHASGRSVQEIVAPAEVEFSHDIGQWITDDCPIAMEAYRHAKPKEMLFQLSEDGQSEIAAALKVWSSDLSGLTKLVTRVRISSQVRVAHPKEASSATMG
jgi:radical SAM superfamily enzyme YgiQ (UPF0313 family)